MNKQQRHEAIRQRAAGALRALYHNATPAYGREMYLPRTRFGGPGYDDKRRRTL